MDAVAGEVGNLGLVDGCAVVDGGVSELVEDVVEPARWGDWGGLIGVRLCYVLKSSLASFFSPRRPLPTSPLGGEGAVVNHKSNPTVVHVRGEGVDGLNDRLVDDLAVAVPSLQKDVDLRHHGGDVDSGGEGVEGDLVVVPVRADPLSNLPGVGSVDLRRA